MKYLEYKEKMINMEYYIDNQRASESYFWNALHGIASEAQKCRLLEGNKVIIGGVCYQISFVEEE